MKARAYLHTSLLLISCLTSSALAGTVIQQVELQPGNEQARQEVTIYMDAGKLRVEGSNPSSGKYLVIFDESKQVTWMVDLAKGSYIEFTAAQVQQMADQMQGVSAQMQQAMQQMEAQMADMPPQQRAMMEQMMKQRMGGMAAAAPVEKTVREKARGEKVGQFTCTRYEILTGGQLSQEVCAAPAGALQVDTSAMETFKALAKFYEPLTRMVPSTTGNWSAPSGMDQIQGFPVQTVMYSNQKPTSEWRVEKIENRSLEASLFELPAGLKKTPMPSMPASR
ncbi:MAG: DUF4412 domain-containing protein [Acidobacteria bacterium]|nr:DUF4412 domain-containing protein [Acidobacteriota bacterium]